MGISLKATRVYYAKAEAFALYTSKVNIVPRLLWSTPLYRSLFSLYCCKLILSFFYIYIFEFQRVTPRSSIEAIYGQFA